MVFSLYNILDKVPTEITFNQKKNQQMLQTCPFFIFIPKYILVDF